LTFTIGISGPIGSGKSYLGNKLVDYYTSLGVKTCYWPFAKILKEMTADMLSNPVLNYSVAFNYFASFERYSIEQVYNAAIATVDAWEEDGKNAVGKKRKFMQLLGTEIGRGILHPDVWIRERDKHTKGYDLVVSDDVRFDNEASASSIHIGIRPTPSEMEEIKAKFESANPGYTYSNHASEKSLTKEPDYRIPYMFTSVDFIKLCDHLNYVMGLKGAFDKWLLQSPTFPKV